MLACSGRAKGLEVLLEALAEFRARGLPVRLRGGGLVRDSRLRAADQAACRPMLWTQRIDWTGFARDIDARVGPHGSLRAAQSLRRGPADGGTGGDVGRAAGRGQRHLGRAGGDSRWRRGPARRDRRVRRRLADAIARFVSGEVSWQAIGSRRTAASRGMFFRRADGLSEVAVYDEVLNGSWNRNVYGVVWSRLALVTEPAALSKVRPKLHADETPGVIRSAGRRGSINLFCFTKYTIPPALCTLRLNSPGSPQRPFPLIHRFLIVTSYILLIARGSAAPNRVAQGPKPLSLGNRWHQRHQSDRPISPFHHWPCLQLRPHPFPAQHLAI